METPLRRRGSELSSAVLGNDSDKYGNKATEHGSRSTPRGERLLARAAGHQLGRMPVADGPGAAGPALALGGAKRGAGGGELCAAQLAPGRRLG